MATCDRDQLQRQLVDLSAKLRVDDKALARSKSVMEEVTGKLLHALRREHGLVRNFEYTGSSYEGTKILKADEFDVMVLLDGSLEGGLKVQPRTQGYASLAPKQSSATIYQQFCAAGTQHLSPSKAISVFTGMVQTQLNRLRFDVPVTVSRHGPAVMLTIKAPHQTIEVDLVPTFIANGNDRYVAKPYKSYADSQETAVGGITTSLLWRKSTSLQEKSKLQGIDADHGCRRKCLKILKYILTQDATLSRLTSFHFKNLVLLECKKSGDWKDAKMADRFLDLLRSLRDCLEKGNLGHCFVCGVNLLDGISEVTRQNIRGRVTGLINSEQARRQLLA